MRRFSWQGCCKGDTNSELPFTALCPPVPVSTCDIKSTFLFQVDAFHLRFSPLPLSNVPSLLLSFSVFHWSLLNIYDYVCVCICMSSCVSNHQTVTFPLSARFTPSTTLCSTRSPLCQRRIRPCSTKKKKKRRGGWKVGILVAMGNFNSILGSILLPTLTRKVALDVWL